MDFKSRLGRLQGELGGLSGLPGALAALSEQVAALEAAAAAVSENIAPKMDQFGAQDVVLDQVQRQLRLAGPGTAAEAEVLAAICTFQAARASDAARPDEIAALQASTMQRVLAAGLLDDAMIDAMLSVDTATT